MERTFFSYKDAKEAVEAAETLECFYTLEKKIRKYKDGFGFKREEVIFILTLLDNGAEYES